MEDLEERVGKAVGVVMHLHAVQNSPALRQAVETIQPRIVDFSLRTARSKPLYNALTKLRDSSGFANLDSVQQRIINKAIQGMTLSGVHFDTGSSQAKRFEQIESKLAELSLQFSNNVMDAIQAWKHVVTDTSKMDGIPMSLKQRMAMAATQAGYKNANAEQGPWIVTLDQPTLIPFLEHCRDRDLRETVSSFLLWIKRFRFIAQMLQKRPQESITIWEFCMTY